MMADSIEEVVYTYLTTDSTFMANFTGVYWEEADTNVSPYIVYWLIDDIGIETRLNKQHQGEARIQFDLWDTNKIRGARLRTTLREKINKLNEVSGGYRVMTTGVNEQSLKRESTTEPFHFIVDGIIKWNKE
jgi:hypothetical protein